ncbi:MAG TPA: LLM class flavin-dependent oxidoreductase [Dehalococcoidia bacterium]|nr:LLM class flavin-dependent oxidoreductase [Dehalococcoidia bacterium]
MKFHWFHLMPYPDLPEDFREKYSSVWVDVPSHLFDPERGHVVYNDYLDELEYAADMGFDGICVNEHHQNAYGMMPSPNLMAASLARRTSNTALVVLGNSIALYNPPTRVAEEMAMLDVISGGRLVAGFPVGTSMDTNFGYGETPITLREKYREAHDLIIKAWTEPEPFAINGKYTQLRYVNTWPRPLQKPHPPIWVPGGGSIETTEWIADKDYLMANLSYAGYKAAKSVMDQYWDLMRQKEKDPNPYSAGFLQLIGVSETEAQAKEDYAEAALYFYQRCLHVNQMYNNTPGYRSLRSMELSMKAGRPSSLSAFSGEQTWEDYLEKGNIIAGTPEQVIEKIRELAKSLNIGHLMMLLQFGNMSKDLTMKNTRLFAEKVMPELKDLWDDEWEDKWWIHPLAAEQTAQPAAVK